MEPRNHSGLTRKNWLATRLDVTIIINFENIADSNAFFGKVEKKIINFRNLFDTAIGLRVRKLRFKTFRF